MGIHQDRFGTDSGLIQTIIGITVFLSGDLNSCYYLVAVLFPTARGFRSNVLVASAPSVRYDEKGDFMKRKYLIYAIIAVLFLSGCSSSNQVITEPAMPEQTSEMISCHYCDRKVPEEYIYIEGDKEICPRCIYGDYKSILEHLSKTPEVFSGDAIVLKKGECFWCGNPAPNTLRFVNDECFCVDCVTEIINDKNIARSIEKYLEG